MIRRSSHDQSPNTDGFEISSDHIRVIPSSCSELIGICSEKFRAISQIGSDFTDAAFRADMRVSEQNRSEPLGNASFRSETLVSGRKLWGRVKTSKIAPKREGPFEIDEVLGPVTYRLKLPETWKIHNVFHAILLQPYTENEVHGGNLPRPLPELLEGEEVYEVESIIKHRRRG